MPQLLGEAPPPKRKARGRSAPPKPDEVLVSVRENLEAARRELIAAGATEKKYAIARRVQRLIDLEARMSQSALKKTLSESDKPA